MAICAYMTTVMWRGIKGYLTSDVVLSTWMDKTVLGNADTSSDRVLVSMSVSVSWHVIF